MAQIGGIYRVYNDSSAQSYVGYSFNIVGAMKRLRFELGMNSCPYKKLQSFYDSYGSFEYEILEELESDTDMYSNEDMKKKVFYWVDKLKKDGLDVNYFQF